MRIDVGRLPPQSVLSSGKGIGSEELAEGVLRAQEYRSWRMVTGHNEASSDAGDVGGKEPSRVARLLGECRLDQGDYRRFEQAAERYHLSGRAIAKTLGVARTIADIEQTLQVTWPQLAEALLYRVGEKL